MAVLQIEVNLTVTPEKPTDIITDKVICLFLLLTLRMVRVIQRIKRVQRFPGADGCTADQVLNLAVTQGNQQISLQQQFVLVLLSFGMGWVIQRIKKQISDSQGLMVCTADQCELTVTRLQADIITNKTIVLVLLSFGMVQGLQRIKQIFKDSQELMVVLQINKY
jgi:hypothetical protein